MHKMAQGKTCAWRMAHRSVCIMKTAISPPKLTCHSTQQSTLRIEHFKQNKDPHSDTEASSQYTADCFLPLGSGNCSGGEKHGSGVVRGGGLVSIVACLSVLNIDHLHITFEMEERSFPYQREAPPTMCAAIDSFKGRVKTRRSVGTDTCCDIFPPC